MGRGARCADRRGGSGARHVPAAPAAAARAHAPRAAAPGARHPVREHDRARTSSRPTRATSRSNPASRRSCAGTRSRWWCAPTARAASWAGTSRATRRRRTSSRWASTISSAAASAGDLVYFQPHSAPGVYARAFLEGRLDSGEPRPLPARDRRRRPVVLSASVADAELLAVPHRLDGPRAALRDLPGALHALPPASRPRRQRGPRKVWAFVGDGEMDEPESLAGLSIAAREKLDNLVLVVNCNLQRLDGPVRGNGSIVAGARRPLRRRGLERDQAALERRLGPALRARRAPVAREALPRDGRRRVPDLRRHRRRVQPRALLQQVSGAAAARRAPVGRRHRSAAPRRPRSGEDLLGVLARRAPRRASPR